MTDQHIEGALKQGVGHVQDGVGGLTGNDRMQAKGKLNEAVGSIQDRLGQVKDQAQAALSDATDQARDTYEGLADRLSGKPLLAIGIGTGLGLVLGLLMRGDKKVVYVPR